MANNLKIITNGRFKQDSFKLLIAIRFIQRPNRKNSSNAIPNVEIVSSEPTQIQRNIALHYKGRQGICFEIKIKINKAKA